MFLKACRETDTGKEEVAVGSVSISGPNIITDKRHIVQTRSYCPAGDFKRERYRQCQVTQGCICERKGRGGDSKI